MSEKKRKLSIEVDVIEPECEKCGRIQVLSPMEIRHFNNDPEEKWICTATYPVDGTYFNVINLGSKHIHLCLKCTEELLKVLRPTNERTK